MLRRPMCVWQALNATDHSAKGHPAKDLVKRVTSMITANVGTGFPEGEFEGHFHHKGTITYDEYVSYLQSVVDKLSKETVESLEEMIEEECWNISRITWVFERFALNESSVRLLWDIFNQLCEQGSLPPTMDQQEANWIADKISSRLGQNWNWTNIPNNVTFNEFVRVLDMKCFHKAPVHAVTNQISNVHSWLVKEHIYTGWLYKCSFKLGSLYGMDKEWFVLKPDRLISYDNKKMSGKRREIPVNSTSTLKHLPDIQFNILTHNCKYRFVLKSANEREVELAVVSKDEKAAWMSAIAEVIEAAKVKESPMQLILNDRMMKKHNKVQNDKKNMKTKSKKTPDKSQPSKVDRYRPVQGKKKAIEQILPMDLQDEKIQEQVNKIQVIFCKFDEDSNGAIDRREFRAFIASLGPKLPETEVDVIFSKIEHSGDGIITMDEFTNYFLNNVLDESGKNGSAAEADLQAAFLQADRDGTGSIDFEEFVEYIWNKRRCMKSTEISRVFEELAEGKEEISLKQFKNLFSDEMLNSGMEETLNGQLISMYNEADAKKIAIFLQDRWKSLNSFERFGASGKVVMSGEEGMVADVLPGEYRLVDLACFTDLPPITPRFAEVDNVHWISAFPKGHGKVIFPPEFDGVIPVEIATTEHLQYYGASLADSTQVEVSLMCRHGIQDFTYENNYLEDYVEAKNGGCGLETHDFSHLDCPLQDDSGYFVIGKMVDNTLQLTAFKVPTRHTLYLPARQIHSNDFMKGTWRTMLSDATNIDHCHIMKRVTAGNDEDLVTLNFSFEKYGL